MVLPVALKELLCASQAHKGSARELPGSPEGVPNPGGSGETTGACLELPKSSQELSGSSQEEFLRIIVSYYI